MKILSSEEFRLVLMFIALFSFLHDSYQISFKNYSYYHFAVGYFLDVAYIVKIYLRFIIPHRNAVGDFVTDRKAIRKRYLSQFYPDAFSCIPFELLCFAFPLHYRYFGWTCLRINRLVRIRSVYYYVTTKYYLRKDIFFLKLLIIFIIFAIGVHIQACVWYILACPIECSSLSWMHQRGKKFCVNDYSCAMYFTISQITFAGLPGPHPRQKSEIIVSILFMIVNKFAFGLFIGHMSTLVYNTNFAIISYEHALKKLKIFLEHDKISETLVSRVLDYMRKLWRKNRGAQVPVYFKYCPIGLKEDLYMQAFGHHFIQNAIFVRCHADFRRLLLRYIQVKHFFDGDTICEQGDVNDTMYFVHSGGVKVYALSENEEIEVDELQECDCFGILQGVVPKTPHTHTFRSAGAAIILSLMYTDWSHLLCFFPASKYAICEAVEQFWS